MKQRTSGRTRRLASWLAVGVLMLGCTGTSIVGGPPDAGSDVVSDLGPSCTGAQVICGNTCTNTQSDPANCGACGTACGTSMLCVAGTCQLTCPMGASACGGTCVNTQTDNANCGACGRACAAGEVCSLGACGTTCAASLATCSSGAGDGGARADGGAATFCADLRSDRLNCGACGTECPAGSICVDRACTLTCAVGQTQCSGACFDLQTNNLHCGACGNACPSGTACTAGVCAVSCGTGLTQCGSTCVNLQTENANCGACGTTCGAGQVCSAGACSTSCAAPLATCASASGAYCANTSIDPANCGMCGRACSLPNTAAAGCADGSCGVVRCAPNFGDCDGMSANGCETDTRDSLTNCGGCGRACVLPNAMPTCAAGTCAVMACAAGFADCDRDPANGCEVNLQSENANCGACGTACGAGQVCSAGACGSTCAMPLTTCTPASGSYCANTQNDPSNCGACGTTCALVNASVQTCVAGRCGVARCNAGFGDCDMVGASGCETNLLTDTSNCGACGRACSLPNATPTCASGACGITACDTGFADCNMRAADGCEVALQTDNANCGACGRTCGAGQVCSGGACTTTCASPLRTCGTSPSQFCANVAVDPANCGACGTACSLPNVADNACASGACAVGTCTASFGDCDAVASNGCETNLASSAANCGACGRICALANASSTCSASNCAVMACTMGFADCNMRAADGCEVALQTDNANCGACGRTCGAGQVCSAGVCTTTCAAPLATCAGAGGSYCANTLSDPSNCGTCGTTCALANASISGCNASACVVVSCGTGFGNCDGAATNGCETNLRTDNMNCGACGNACAGGQSCVSGACACPAGQTLCGGACVDLRTNSTNCGVCGRACVLTNATSACVSSVCAVTACGTGFADCDGSAASGCETNTQTDSTNCGACGRTCGAGQVCSRGVCATTCATPLTTCSSGGASYCANTTIDPANCGACGRACALPNASASGCGAGACTVQTCATGFGDCNGTASDGCETNLLTSSASCGACGRACTLANATAACGAGACAITACATGFFNCNGTASDGCEVNLQADNNNCGACGRTCAAGQVCSSGACTATCASPLTTCGTLAAAYCANTSNDPANCGACGRACALTNATASGCAAGACTVLTCATGFGNCDGVAANGCETDLNTTVSSCGACGRACALANAGETCTAGACAITTCDPGFLNCNASAADGCEVNTATDNANCGACGRGCAAGQVCSAGACVATCGAPLTLCSGGCVNLTNDPTRCGSCTTTCTAGPNSIAVCAASTCAFVCTSGFADCDRVATNGCEANLNTSTSTCGTCGTVCPARANATPTCAAGACGFTCNPGFGDCDGVAANGCEANLNTNAAHCGRCGTSCGASACTAGSCGPRCNTAPARVLIYGPGGTFSQGRFPAGTIVTVASDAMWRSMTTANFGEYDVLWVDGNRCSGSTATFATLSATQGTWGPAVTGRVSMNSADPDYHSSLAGASLYISNHVTWLAGLGRNSAGGRTGFYFSWGCSLLSASSPTPASFIPTFGSPLAHTTTNGEPTAITAAGASHPVLSGITLSALRWGNYCHGAFSAIPTGYSSLLTCPTNNSGLFVRQVDCVP